MSEQLPKPIFKAGEVLGTKLFSIKTDYTHTEGVPFTDNELANVIAQNRTEMVKKVPFVIVYNKRGYKVNHDSTGFSVTAQTIGVYKAGEDIIAKFITHKLNGSAMVTIPQTIERPDK